jgi:putative ABC transport system ATP-binding protein
VTSRGGDGRLTGQLIGRALSFDVGKRRVLDGVSVVGEPGRMLAVTGTSGSGKTTLLSLVGGLAEPAAGSASYDGGPVTTKGGEPLPGTGFVLQSYGLVATLTAAENVSIALRGRGVAPAEAGARAVEALARVGVDELADRLISELSGGQLQRVAVARALVVEPVVLLADEPTSELDEVNRDLVVAQLRTEAIRGAVVVVATHDPAVAEACDEELHLVDGRVEMKASPPPAPEPGHENDSFMRPGPA